MGSVSCRGHIFYAQLSLVSIRRIGFDCSGPENDLRLDSQIFSLKFQISKRKEKKIQHTGSGSGNGSIFGRLARAAPKSAAPIIFALASDCSTKNAASRTPAKANKVGWNFIV